MTMPSIPEPPAESFAGQRLDRFCGTPMPLLQFLDVAIAIAGALAKIHERGITHKNIKPENILLDRSTGEVQIVDFRIASHLPREQPAVQKPSVIAGTPAYMSPEQTGRMNRWIDNRTDLYSLGVTLYELLTGRLPFLANDPLEWFHAHIARAPAPISEIAPAVPDVVSTIVLKLLAKAAEHRYESALGLKADLERCAAELRAAGRIDNFELGKQDPAGRFHIPQKLYGRDADITELFEAFDSVVAESAPTLLLVSGSAGVGKSSLVHELHKPALRERGFFVAGKFDQYKRDIPYATLIEAFRGLILEILSESTERIEEWRRAIQSGLGIHGAVLADVIPQLELIIGKQPAVADLPATESQRRFNMVFRNFVGVFARKEHPLALFLDDLQWTDLASLKLLQDILTHPDTAYLLTIGAYRDNEVDSSHPLTRMLEEVRASGVFVREIVLAPLSARELTELVADAVRCRREDAEPLARLVHEKTGGNPFFATQFLTRLHDERLIDFDPQSGAFRCDIARIEAKGFTDNVVDLMVAKLKKLPTAAQKTIELAACTGGTVDVHMLSILANQSEEQIHQALWAPVREGLLLCVGDRYRFIHDRIQQSAYSLIPQKDRAGVHLRIGRVLLAHVAPGTLEEKVFDIVNQLNLAASQILEPGERTELAQLNLIAGKKATASTAYASAIHYLSAGMDLLDAKCWEDSYRLAYDLQLTRAKCEFVSGNFAVAEGLLSGILHHVKSRADAAAVYCLKILLNTIQDKLIKSVEECSEYLQSFGIDLPVEPTEAQVEAAYKHVWRALGDRPIEELLDLPAITDPELKGVMDVLTVLISPALYTSSHLLSMLLCHMVTWSLEYGNADGSSLGYIWFGMVLGPSAGRYRDGYRFGKLGYDLVEKRGLAGVKAKVYLAFALLSSWNQPYHRLRDLFDRAFTAAIEAGDLTYACFCCNNLTTLLLIQGEPLDDVYRESERWVEFARKAKFENVVSILVNMQRLIQNLRGLTIHFSTYNDDHFDEAAHEASLHQKGMSITRCWYYIWKIQARFMSGDHEAAVRMLPLASGLLWSSPSFMEICEHYYYSSLALAAYYPEAPAAERSGYLQTLLRYQDQLRSWAEHFPDNFLPKHALVAAEIARIQGDTDGAVKLYEQAIESAHASGFIQNEGIGYELAGKFHLSRGLPAIGYTCMREARRCYLRWGAHGKVRQLDSLYPRLIDRRHSEAPIVTVRHEELDWLAVGKALQHISGEIVLPSLAEKLMRVMIEQTGAQKGYLIRDTGDGFSIETEIEADPSRAQLAHPDRNVGSAVLPVTIVNYVTRTREIVLLDDAAGEVRFSRDEYMMQIKPKSVLCVPLVRAAELFGVVYLENNLSVGAFTRNRLPVLKLLASQAAISIEHATLYSKLTKENAERERAEAVLKEKLAIIEEQRDAIRTLSLPIIEVWSGVLMVPVLGTVDHQRAQQMMSSLLNAVVETSARYVILDFTAVPSMDAVAAAHVLKVVSAVELVGAESIVAGIQADAARAMVALGLDLTRVMTVKNLHEALLRCQAGRVPPRRSPTLKTSVPRR